MRRPELTGDSANFIVPPVILLIMPCLLALLVVLFPRVILVLMWLFSNALDRAYHNLVIPVLGFIFLPLTTVVYAWMVNSGLPIEGINLFLLIIAAIIDVSGHGGGARYYRRRKW